MRGDGGRFPASLGLRRDVLRGEGGFWRSCIGSGGEGHRHPVAGSLDGVVAGLKSRELGGEGSDGFSDEILEFPRERRHLSIDVLLDLVEGCENRRKVLIHQYLVG